LLDSGRVIWTRTGVIWTGTLVSCITGTGKCMRGPLFLRVAKEWTSAVKHPFCAMGVIAALLIVVTVGWPLR
jgi:hypothetical protein